MTCEPSIEARGGSLWAGRRRTVGGPAAWLVGLAALLAGLVGPAGAMSKQEFAELQLSCYRGKSPEYIARFFVHPNGAVAQQAMRAMVVEHGRQAVPLLEKLLHDEHPMMRASAVDVLAMLYMPPKQKGRPGRQKPPVTPELERLMRLVEPLANDPHPAVNQAVARLSIDLGVETPATRRVAIEMARSAELTVRQQALQIGRTIITDPDTHVKIGMNVSAFPDNLPRVWGHAHDLINRHRNDPVCRQAIPTLANFLLNIANTRPVRGMFSDGPQVRALETLTAQWDKQVEQMKNVVPAICCVYVRVPYGFYPGWLKCRQLAFALLKKMSRSSAPAIRAYVVSERKWLAQADLVTLQLFGVRNLEKGRAQFNKAIDYLEYVADCLEAGKPITRPSPIPLEEPKQYQDKMPEIGDLNLDIELE